MITQARKKVPKKRNPILKMPLESWKCILPTLKNKESLRNDCEPMRIMPMNA